MSDFRKALFGTAVPIIVLGVISAGGRMAVAASDAALVAFDVLGVVAAGLLGLAILAAIGFTIARKRQIAAGILAGVGIGIVGLGVTCFAPLLVTGL